MYNEGCDEGDDCWTTDPRPEPAPARERCLCWGAFAHPSLATLLWCFAVIIAVSEHEADELEEVIILTEKFSTHNPMGSTVFRTSRHYMEGFRGGPASSSVTFASTK